MCTHKAVASWPTNELASEASLRRAQVEVAKSQAQVVPEVAESQDLDQEMLVDSGRRDPGDIIMDGATEDGADGSHGVVSEEMDGSAPSGGASTCQ